MMAEVDARDVLEKYTAILKAGQSVVRDAADLPYPKEVIKVVLKSCLTRVDDDKTKEELKKAYMDLGSFQPLTKAEREAVEAMSKVTDARSTDDQVMEQVRVVALHGDLHHVVAERSFKETEALFLEVRAL
jgi:hypothetical protein